MGCCRNPVEGSVEATSKDPPESCGDHQIDRTVTKHLIRNPLRTKLRVASDRLHAASLESDPRLIHSTHQITRYASYRPP